jgi:hypothetical protein
MFAYKQNQRNAYFSILLSHTHMSKNNYLPTILVAIMLIVGFTTGTNAAGWDMMTSQIDSTNTGKTTTSSTVETYPSLCPVKIANTETSDSGLVLFPVDFAFTFDLGNDEANYINKVTLLSKECECIGTLVSEPEYKTFYTPFILDKDGCAIKTSYLASSLFVFCTQTELVKKL